MDVSDRCRSREEEQYFVTYLLLQNVSDIYVCECVGSSGNKGEYSQIHQRSSWQRKRFDVMIQVPLLVSSCQCSRHPHTFLSFFAKVDSLKDIRQVGP